MQVLTLLSRHAMLRALVVVDPYSTGRHIVDAAIARGLCVIALWSARHQGGSLTEASCVVDQQDDMAATVAALQRAAASIGASIAGVCCGGDDGIDLCASCAASLSLPGNMLWSDGRHRGDKEAQQAAIAAAGLRHARSGRGWSDAVVDESMGVVVKLRHGTGSEGARHCCNEQEAESHADFLFKHHQDQSCVNREEAVLVQEYLEGVEYVVDCVSRDGVHVVTMIWEYDKRPANGASFVYYGERPVLSDSAEAKVLVPYALEVLTALGIMTGPTHTEIMLDSARGVCTRTHPLP